MPGGDAFSPAGFAVGRGVFAMDQAVHLVSPQTASPGHGCGGGEGVFDASGGEAKGVGQHSKSSIKCGFVPLQPGVGFGNGDLGEYLLASRRRRGRFVES